MGTLRLSELYVSMQGEGPNVGRPTVFVRFAGCNFKCPGWACDTPQSIDPRIFTKEQRFLSAAELAEEIIELGIPNICFTGGEVFIQDIDELECLLVLLSKNHTAVVSCEVFTNGSRMIPRHVKHYFDNVIMDWKLPGSGEVGISKNRDEAYEESILHNLRLFGPHDAIKFTIKDGADYELAKARYYQLLEIMPSLRGVVYCGPVWGHIESEELSRRIIEDRLPWFLNTQLHKYIYDPKERYI